MINCEECGTNNLSGSLRHCGGPVPFVRQARRV
jgi:hypothetical protein